MDLLYKKIIEHGMKLYVVEDMDDLGHPVQAFQNGFDTVPTQEEADRGMTENLLRNLNWETKIMENGGGSIDLDGDIVGFSIGAPITIAELCELSIKCIFEIMDTHEFDHIECDERDDGDYIKIFARKL